MWHSCLISPTLVNIFLDNGGLSSRLWKCVCIGGKITILWFEYDIVLHCYKYQLTVVIKPVVLTIESGAYSGLTKASCNRGHVQVIRLGSYYYYYYFFLVFTIFNMFCVLWSISFWFWGEEVEDLHATFWQLEAKQTNLDFNKFLISIRIQTGAPSTRCLK